MKEIKITDSKIKEALEQIDTIAELGPKERGCLRLLTEEMFSICREILGTYALNFEIRQDGRQYTLFGSTKARVDETAREQLLSVSSSGKNAANKGLKGIMGAILDAFFAEGGSELCKAEWAGGMCHEGDMRMWSLSRYIQELEANKAENEWDGLEKSIIANFADDVSIGVRSGRLEMTVTKTY